MNEDVPNAPPPLGYERHDPPPDGTPTVRRAIGVCVLYGLLEIPMIVLAVFVTVQALRGNVRGGIVTQVFCWIVIPLLWLLAGTLLYWVVWYIRAVSTKRK